MCERGGGGGGEQHREEGEMEREIEVKKDSENYLPSYMLYNCQNSQ